MSIPPGLLMEAKCQRACDMCRRRRARCDGAYQVGSKCSNCANQGFSCTYVEQSTRHAPSKKYISGLENRLQELEKALRMLCPDETNYDVWVESLSEDKHNIFPQISSRPKVEPLKNATSAGRFPHEGSSPSRNDEDEDDSAVIANSLRTDRFFGESSGEELARTALFMRQQYIGGHGRPILANRREEFWMPRPWELRPRIFSPRRFTFPEPDLAKELVEYYFFHVNLCTPILHRPTFEKSIRDGFHYTREGFADVYLLVCAIGARFSSDPRARANGADSRLAAGWQWYNQVEIRKMPLLSLPSLYDIQVACLRIVFITNSSSPMAVWPLLGVATRMAQDVGAHRRKSTAPTVEDELWKRLFWILFYGDRLMSLSMGRPLIIQEEDFDLDLPIDCDDEYWEHPDPQKRFKQPPNKPSSTIAFILSLKLMRILATCSRVIYPINKASLSLGLIDKHRRSNFVAELDAGIDQWLASVPPHLRWNPKNQTNDKFFNQSAMIHSLCCFTRMFIHRPHILSPKGPLSPQALESLKACTPSAHACIDVIDTLVERGLPSPPICQMALFNSCLVLLLKTYGEKAYSQPRSPSTSTDERFDLEQVQKGLRILKSLEHLCIQAGRFWDTLSSLFPEFKANGFALKSTDKRPHAPPLHLQSSSHWWYPQTDPGSRTSGVSARVIASTCTPNDFGDMVIGQTSFPTPNLPESMAYRGPRSPLHGNEDLDVFSMWATALPDLE